MDDQTFRTIYLNPKVKPVKNSDHLLEEMTKGHHNYALQSFENFKEDLIKNLQIELNEIKTSLQAQLGRAVRKLQNKVKGNYKSSLIDSLKTFYIDSYISKEIKEVRDSVLRLKEKITSYINQFCNIVLSLNIKKSQQVSLFYFTNRIKSVHSQWYSVTSRCPLSRAEVYVSGFNRPQTTWLALGVSKKIKEYGPVMKNLTKQDFMGNIYLNGSNHYDEEYRLKKDLNSGDIFVIESNNRMVWVYRKLQGKNKKQTFIMDDNVPYFFYLAMKGPISLQFMGQ